MEEKLCILNLCPQTGTAHRLTFNSSSNVLGYFLIFNTPNDFNLYF